jgi:glycosyltransferase involved in cell wall biosynthesis
MYSISFPINVYRTGRSSFCLPAGLARDIIAQLSCEESLNIICPVASSFESVPSPYHLDLKDHPGLTVTLLPHSGNRSFWRYLWQILLVLKRSAETSTIWHTGCSTSLFDLTTASFFVGRFFAPGMRVVCLDSDPASMLASSGLLKRWKAPIIRARYRKWVQEVDATIFVGSGAEDTYSSFCRHFVTTGAVWLNEGDLVDSRSTAAKFDQPENDTVRISLPTRLNEWKGVDDVLAALEIVRDRLPPWHLDIIGEGPMKRELQRQAKPFKGNVTFLGAIDYGEPFFSKLRTYHMVLVPTRGLEEARIVYDAAASGCVLLHSSTPTLVNAMRDVAIRWQFEPGNIAGLSNALLAIFEQRQIWKAAALQGVDAMRGKTIQEMHHKRSTFLRSMIDR